MSDVSTTRRTAWLCREVPRRRGLPPRWLLALVLGLGFHSAEAFAEASPTEKALAETLFVEGKDLMTAGRHAEACPKLEQSQRIEGAIGTMLYLAECYEKTQRLASAWAMFRDASSRARAEGQMDRAKTGEDRAKLLEPMLSKLTVAVPVENQVPELSLTLDDHPLPLTLTGTPLPVDGGEHTVSASAPGYEPLSARIAVSNSGGSITVTIPALKPLPAAAQEPVAPPPPPPPSTPPPDTASSGTSTGEIVGLALAGVGLAGVGVGVYFGLDAQGKDDEAESVCPRSAECNDQRGIDLTEEAQSQALLANVLYGVGGAAIIAGAVVYFTSGDSSSESGRAQPPSFSLGSARLYPDVVVTPSHSFVSIHSEF